MKLSRFTNKMLCHISLYSFWKKIGRFCRGLFLARPVHLCYHLVIPCTGPYSWISLIISRSCNIQQNMGLSTGWRKSSLESSLKSGQDGNFLHILRSLLCYWWLITEVITPCRCQCSTGWGRRPRFWSVSFPCYCNYSMLLQFSAVHVWYCVYESVSVPVNIEKNMCLIKRFIIPKLLCPRPNRRGH